jgi:hypothetical protein
MFLLNSISTSRRSIVDLKMQIGKRGQPGKDSVPGSSCVHEGVTSLIRRDLHVPVLFRNHNGVRQRDGLMHPRNALAAVERDVAAVVSGRQPVVTLPAHGEVAERDRASREVAHLEAEGRDRTEQWKQRRSSEEEGEEEKRTQARAGFGIDPEFRLGSIRVRFRVHLRLRSGVVFLVCQLSRTLLQKAACVST